MLIFYLLYISPKVQIKIKCNSCNNLCTSYWQNIQKKKNAVLPSNEVSYLCNKCFLKVIKPKKKLKGLLVEGEENVENSPKVSPSLKINNNNNSVHLSSTPLSPPLINITSQMKKSREGPTSDEESSVFLSQRSRRDGRREKRRCYICHTVKTTQWRNKIVDGIEILLDDFCFGSFWCVETQKRLEQRKNEERENNSNNEKKIVHLTSNNNASENGCLTSSQNTSPKVV